MELAVALVGMVVGLVAGTVGVGGAILFIPLTFVLSAAVGSPELSVHTIAGLSAIQVACAAGVAGLVHARAGNIDFRILISVGVPMIACASVAGALAVVVPDNALVAVFAVAATVAAALVAVRWKLQEQMDKASVPDMHAILLGGGVGTIAGLIGVGGAFLLLPGMVRLLAIPLRLAIGSSLAVACIGSAAAFLAKWAGGQVDLGLAGAVVAGTFPGAMAGAIISQSIAVTSLRRTLVLILVIVAAASWIQLVAELVLA